MYWLFRKSIYRPQIEKKIDKKCKISEKGVGNQWIQKKLNIVKILNKNTSFDKNSKILKKK